MKQFFIDLLKVQDPEKKNDENWSQSRVYLLLSLLVFFGMVISSYFLGEANTNFQHAIDALMWIITIFASYALVSKGLKYNQMKKVAEGFDRNSPKIKKAIGWASSKMEKEEKDNN